jgi:DNA modification methylase
MTSLNYDRLQDLLKRRHPGNPKGHDLDAIRASMRRFGYVTPVVVNDRDGRIVEGHGRTEALEAMRVAGEPAPQGVVVDDRGRWLIPTVHGVDLAPEDIEAFLVAANRTVELGGWNETLLADLLNRISTSDRGLAGTGFTTADMDALVASLGRESTHPDPEDAPARARPRDVHVKSGALYRLGEHRLLAGDATSRDDVLRLSGEALAACLWTDPPYGVEYESGGGLTIKNDTAAGIPDLLCRSFAAVGPVLAPGAALYICHPAGPLSLTFGQAIVKAGWHIRQTLVWVKDSPVLGHADFHYRHEPIIYARKPGPGRFGRGARGWYGGNSASSVFEVPRPRAARDHPTMKPVRLVAAMLEYATRPGDIVIDPFTGSGSTLIACELLGRRFLGLEIDPVYAQVTIDRWERYTGRRAVQEGA